MGMGAPDAKVKIGCSKALLSEKENTGRVLVSAGASAAEDELIVLRKIPPTPMRFVPPGVRVFSTDRSRGSMPLPNRAVPAEVRPAPSLVPPLGRKRRFALGKVVPPRGHRRAAVLGLRKSESIYIYIYAR
jgi:hypothetical protein